MHPLESSGKHKRALADLAAKRESITPEEYVLAQISILEEVLASAEAELRTAADPESATTTNERWQAELDSWVRPELGRPFDETVRKQLDHARSALDTLRNLVGTKAYQAGFVGTLQSTGGPLVARVTRVFAEEADARRAAEDFVIDTPGHVEGEHYDWDLVDDVDTTLRRISREDPVTGIAKPLV
jgi:hypothetical protein